MSDEVVKSLIEGIHGSDNKIGGRAVTKLRAALSATDTTAVLVEQTIGFGLLREGSNVSRIRINGEIIEAALRDNTVGNYRFVTLTRGIDATTARAHPAGSLVYDDSRNTSAIDQVRRATLVNYAQGEDLSVLGRNLGLHRCNGIDDETWRRLIPAMAYVPKQPLQAFERVLEAYFNNTTSWHVYEKVDEPYVVYAGFDVFPGEGARGRFVLNGGERVVTTALAETQVLHPIGQLMRVVRDTPAARRGLREGMTDYVNPGGTFVGSTITLNASPGVVGTGVIVDYRPAGDSYHYLAPNENTYDEEDRYAYLSNVGDTIRCLLNQVATGGIIVKVVPRSPVP